MAWTDERLPLWVGVLLDGLGTLLRAEDWGEELARAHTES